MKQEFRDKTIYVYHMGMEDGTRYNCFDWAFDLLYILLWAATLLASYKRFFFSSLLELVIIIV